MTPSYYKHLYRRFPHISVIAVSCVLLLINSCSSSMRGASYPTPQATQPVGSHATQWKVAYLDQTAHVHAIGLDGTQDQQLVALTDPILNDRQQAHTAFFINTINPDGHTMSYGQTSLHFVDIRQQVPDRSVNTHTVITNGAWSPDGKQEIVTDGIGNFYLLQTRDASFRSLGGNPYQSYELLGWLDATHVAAARILHLADPNANNADGYAVDSIDVVSGSRQHLASFQMSHLGFPDGKLAPDGQHVLVFDNPWRDEPFSPLVGVIDLHTGAMKRLPAISQQTGAFLTSVAWGPDNKTVVATTGFGINNDLQTWVLHLDTDTAVKTTTAGYILAWNAPTNTVLASPFGGGGEGVLQLGPYTITAMQVQPEDTFKTTVLTNQAYSATGIGFIPPTAP